MKEYTKPKINIEVIEVEDVIACSSDNCNHENESSLVIELPWV